jgi:hypothetical protein
MLPYKHTGSPMRPAESDPGIAEHPASSPAKKTSHAQPMERQEPEQEQEAEHQVQCQGQLGSPLP